MSDSMIGTATAGLVIDNSVVTSTRLVCDDTAGTGVVVFGEETEALLEDLTVRRSEAAGADDFPYGVFVLDGARATIGRARLEDNQCSGVVASGAGVLAQLHDVRIERTSPCTDEEYSPAGVYIDSGAALELLRSVISEPAHYGVLTEGDGSTLSLENVSISDTRPDVTTGLAGVGLALWSGAAATVGRSVVERSASFGVQAIGATSLSLEDVLISDMSSAASDSRFRRGLHVEGGGDVSLAGCQVLGSRDVGIALFDEWAYMGRGRDSP